MVRKTQDRPPVWRIPDDLWKRIEPILAEYDPPARTGAPRADQRRALDAAIYRLRTGCQWAHMPAELGDDSTNHRTLQRWVRLGVLERIWAMLVTECGEQGLINWTWQSADAAMGKARMGGMPPARTRPIGPSLAVNGVP